MMHRSKHNALFLAVALSAAVPLTAVAEDARLHLDGLAEKEFNDRFIVKYRDGSAAFASSAQRTKSLQLAGNGGRAKLQHLRRLAVGADVVRADRLLDHVEAETLMRALAADPAVEYVEVDARVSPTVAPNDTFYGQYQWAFNKSNGGTHADWAWNRARGGGTIVAVLDTGITSHGDLSSKTVAGYDFIADVPTAGDGNGRDASPADPGDWVTAGQCGEGEPAKDSGWHGTHVAGTVGAVTYNGLGVAGMAPNAKVQPVRVLGKCGGYVSDISDAIVWASGGSVSGVPANATPAEVINLSLGGGGSCGTTYQTAINTAVGRGTVVVVAAGNGNENVANSRPANCSNVIAVGSTRRAGGRASYSNFGAGVDVSAPGGGAINDGDWILSTGNAGTQGPTDAVYSFMVGTSMAAPHVAGLAAMMQAIRPLTPAQVEAQLKLTARPFAIPCGNCGAGIINAEAAVNGLLGYYHANRTVYGIPATGRIVSPINVSRGGNASSTLRVSVYISHARPSDLIVSVRSPDGTWYRLHTNTETGLPGINNTYTVNASGERAAGQWQLSVNDNRGGVAGSVTRWALQF